MTPDRHAGAVLLLVLAAAMLIIGIEFFLLIGGQS